MSLPLAAMFAALVFSFEILLPWDKEVKVRHRRTVGVISQLVP